MRSLTDLYDRVRELQRRMDKAGARSYGALRTIFSKSANTTVNNTGTPTSIVGTGAGKFTLPADLLVAGRTVRVRARGHFSTTGTPSLRLRLLLGGTILINSGAVNMPNNAASLGWLMDAELTCRSVGVGGSVISQGMFFYGGGFSNDMVDTATDAIDTTIANDVDVTVDWGTASASNTITCTHLTIELLN